MKMHSADTTGRHRCQNPLQSTKTNQIDINIVLEHPLSTTTIFLEINILNSVAV